MFHISNIIEYDVHAFVDDFFGFVIGVNPVLGLGVMQDYPDLLPSQDPFGVGRGRRPTREAVENLRAVYADDSPRVFKATKVVVNLGGN